MRRAYIRDQWRQRCFLQPAWHHGPEHTTRTHMQFEIERLVVARRFQSFSCHHEHETRALRVCHPQETLERAMGCGFRHAVQVEARLRLELTTAKTLCCAPIETGGMK